MSALTFQRVSVRVRDKELLSDISLSLEPGEFLALVGPNGAGKTTLLRSAIGLLHPSHGRVLLGGRDVTRLGPRERASQIAWLPQHQSISEPLSAVEIVAAARFRFGESASDSERHARAALERVHGAELSNARFHELSGGERQRVSMAALLAQGTKLALLDEPASHLDPAHQLETYRLLGELWNLGVGILLVTHDINLIGQLGSPDRVRIIGLRGGKQAFSTSFSATDLPERLGALFGLRFSALEHTGRRILLADAANSENAGGGA